MFFFFNDTATTEIYTLSLHDALPICLHRLARRELEDGLGLRRGLRGLGRAEVCHVELFPLARPDRKSTRLNSSHANISYAVFCLKKKTNYSVLIFSRTTLSSLHHHC